MTNARLEVQVSNNNSVRATLKVTKIILKTFSTILSFLNLKALVTPFHRFAHFATKL